MDFENRKQLAVIFLALGLGVIAAFLTSQYIESTLDQKSSKALKEFEQKTVGEFSARIQKLEGGLNQIAKGQEALNNKLKEPPPKPGEPPKQPDRVGVFSYKTPAGKRAMTIEIDSLSAVGGLINTGDFVDVIAQLKIPDPNDTKKEPEKLSTVLFQNIEVLAVDTNFAPITAVASYTNQQKAKSLTVALALTPEEAGLLSFVQSNNAKIQLSLRSPEEKDKTDLPAATWESLADFVREQQGTELVIPKAKADIQQIGGDEVKPYIQIFKGGKEF